jgi:hypothetical protein
MRYGLCCEGVREREKEAILMLPCGKEAMWEGGKAVKTFMNRVIKTAKIKIDEDDGERAKFPQGKDASDAS